MIEKISSALATKEDLLSEHDQEIREKAVDEFADRMISMMPGHKQDILRVAEQLKDTEKDCGYER